MCVSHVGFHKDVFKPSLLKSTAVFLVFVFAWTIIAFYQIECTGTCRANSSRNRRTKSISIIEYSIRNVVFFNYYREGMIYEVC